VRALITGGRGYVGSAVVRALLAAGHQVTVFDSLSRGGPGSSVPPEVDFFRGNINSFEDIFRALDKYPYDAVVHLAAETDAGRSVRDPGPFYRTNVAGGINLLDAMSRTGCRRIIFSSTCAVYGDASEGRPVTEDFPTAPINPYGRSKLLFESILAGWGLEHVILRYANVAGSAGKGLPGAASSCLLPKLLESAAFGLSQAGTACQDVVINGIDYPTPDGTCVRDYVHVLDVADFHARILPNVTRFSGLVFNVGSGRGHSNLKVVRTVREVTGNEVPILPGPRREGDPASLVLDCGRAERELGWRAAHSGLGEIVRSAWEARRP